MCSNGIVGPQQRAVAQAAATRGAAAEVGTDVGVAAGRSIAGRAVSAAASATARVIAAALAAVTGISASTVLLVAAIVIAVIAVFLPMINQAATQEQASIGGVLGAESGVPGNLIPLYNKAGALCPEMPAVLLAARGEVG